MLFKTTAQTLRLVVSSYIGRGGVSIWLNGQLIYHNQIARWMPAVRHFESDGLKEGRYRIAVMNQTTGERTTREFAAQETRHIVIFDRRAQSMTMRAFPALVQFR